MSITAHLRGKRGKKEKKDKKSIWKSLIHLETKVTKNGEKRKSLEEERNRVECRHLKL